MSDKRKCAACGKHAYANEMSAIRWALIRSKAQGRPLRIYKCPHGNGLHLTKRLTPPPSKPTTRERTAA